MTDTTRMLTPEMRENRKAELKGKKFTTGTLGEHEQFELNALHDLDVADAQIKSAALEIAERSRERDQAYRDREQAIGFLDQRSAELAAAQATIAQQGAVIAAMRDAYDKLRSAYLSVRPGGGGHWSEAFDCPNTDRVAALYDAYIRAEERRKVLEEVKTALMGMSLTGDFTEAAASSLALVRGMMVLLLDEQLAVQPEEETNG